MSLFHNPRHHHRRRIHHDSANSGADTFNVGVTHNKLSGPISSWVQPAATPPEHITVPKRIYILGNIALTTPGAVTPDFAAIDYRVRSLDYWPRVERPGAAPAEPDPAGGAAP